jgi:two-component system cell cycle sensor histidine kinase/response regulator CckA
MLKTVRVPEKFAPLFEQAQEYVARYFSDLGFGPERGTVEISGERYVLVRAASLSIEFHRMVKKLYSEDDEALAVTQAILFDLAHAMGMADSQAFAERMCLADPVERLSAGPVHFAHAGWAFVDISEESRPSPDDDYYLLYDHPYSFESDAWIQAGARSATSVCIMNSGYSSGWCEHSFGMELAAVELLCRGKGDETCRFIMAPPERIEAHVESYRRQHPELAKSIAPQRVLEFFGQRTDRQLLRQNLVLADRAEQRARELAEANRKLELDIRERERAETLLGHSRELTERLIEALPGGVVHVTIDGAIVRANAEACHILGLSYDQLTQRFVSDFETETVFEDGTPAHPREYPVSRALASGEPQPNVTLGVRKPNGEVSWAVFRAVPIRDPATQNVTGAVVSFLDITERKRIESKLLHTQKLESLGVLAGGVAHDFNNLLVSILGNTSLARSSPECPPALAPLLEQVEESARRAAELTKQMLDYAGQGRSRVTNVLVPNVLRDMGSLAKTLIPKQIELRYQFQEGLPAIQADDAQLRQVLMNLVMNASEAIGDKPGRIDVSVECRSFTRAELDDYVGETSEGTFVRLEVRDDGAGMSPETLARVFDPFFTTKSKGRGLGMAAVLGIVQSHAGAVRVESREQHGTRVILLLPVRSAVRNPEPDAGQARATILVVDDDDGVRSVAARALSARGYRVLTAVNGADGVRVFEQNRSTLSLVLMDVTMPEMNGFDALRHIRATGSRVPVLLSSGYELDPGTLSPEDFSGILEKPYDVQALIAAVEAAIAGSSRASSFGLS